MSDRKRILDKISKLLNLGNDSRGNANECATALRQAQSLMDKHGITKDELGLIGYSSETVQCPIQVSRKTIPMRLNLLIDIIEKAFGVHPVIGSEKRVSDYSYIVTYFGPANRVMLAVYSHTVVQRALDAAWREYLREKPELRGARGARAGFEMGWLDAVRSKVEALAVSDEEKEQTQALIKKTYGRELDTVKSNNMAVDGMAAIDGAVAASDFSLNRPMERENLKIEG